MDLISRQAAIDALKAHFCDEDRATECGAYWHHQQVIDVLKALPSANPGADEWCVDCREYDKENHCCPRFNRVIRKTLDEAYAHGETEAEARFLEKLRREGK